MYLYIFNINNLRIYLLFYNLLLIKIYMQYFTYRLFSEKFNVDGKFDGEKIAFKGCERSIEALNQSQAEIKILDRAKEMVRTGQKEQAIFESLKSIIDFIPDPTVFLICGDVNKH